MELRNISTFLMVAELQNFTKSAEALGYSQAAVTVQVKQLEKELGVSLFDRFSWGVQLTAAGEAFMPYAKRLIEDSEEALNFAKKTEEPEGSIHIGATASIANALIPDLLLEFHRKYPKIYISVMNSDIFTDLFDSVKSNELDFAFITSSKTDYPGLTKAAENQTEIVFVSNKNHPLAGKGKIPLYKIARHEIITSDRDKGYGLAMEEFFSGHGYPLKPIMDFGSTSSIIKLLLSNDLISFLPYKLVEAHIKGGRLALIHPEESPDMQIFNQMYYNSNKWLNPAMKVFIEFMQKEFV